MLCNGVQMIEDTDSGRFRWIMRTGWKGLCPRCGKGHMFKSWLKIADRCDACGLDYRFAAPDDGPAFFSLCFATVPLTVFLVWLQVVMDPPWWVHLLTTLPLMVLSVVLPLRPIKGWLVASQYVNRAQEAGTGKLWDQLHGRENTRDSSNFDD